jgi:hypothetical protein
MGSTAFLPHFSMLIDRKIANCINVMAAPPARLPKLGLMKIRVDLMSKRFFIFVTASILTACGGGGSGGGGTTASAPTATAALTTNNAAEISGATIDAALASSEFDQLADLGVLGSPATAAVTLSASDASVSLARKTAQLQAATAEVSVGPETTECPLGGFMTISATIQNQETLSAGDTFSLSYMDCNFGEGIVANGGVGFTVTSFQGDLVGEDFELGFDLNIDNLQMAEIVDNVTFDGDISMSLSITATMTTVTVSGSSLSLTSGTETFSLSDYSTTATVDQSVFPNSFTLESSGYLMSSKFDGEVHFSTTIALEGSGEGNPVGGEFVVTGADGATVTVIPMDEQNVRLELDLDGDDAVDENGTMDMTWQELLDTSAV